MEVDEKISCSTAVKKENGKKLKVFCTQRKGGKWGPVVKKFWFFIRHAHWARDETYSPKWRTFKPPSSPFSLSRNYICSIPAKFAYVRHGTRIPLRRTNSPPGDDLKRIELGEFIREKVRDAYLATSLHMYSGANPHFVLFFSSSLPGLPFQKNTSHHPFSATIDVLPPFPLYFLLSWLTFLKQATEETRTNFVQWPAALDRMFWKESLEK